MTFASGSVEKVPDPSLDTVRAHHMLAADTGVAVGELFSGTVALAAATTVPLNDFVGVCVAWVWRFW